MIFKKFAQFLFAATALNAVLGGCSVPQTSRTATIHDIKIEEGISPDNLLVQPGDEVRWINLRKMNVTVDIPTLKSETLACQREFSNWVGVLRETATLAPNETASLCFEKRAVVNYNVRSETALAGGKLILPGVVKVGTPQPTGSTMSEQSSDRTGTQPSGRPSGPPSSTSTTTTTTTTTPTP